MRLLTRLFEKNRAWDSRMDSESRVPANEIAGLLPAAARARL